MHPFHSLSRLFLPAALLPSLALAVPTAVNDTFTTPEDVAAGSAAVDLINATFEPGGGAPAFTLPNTWQVIDLKTTAAGGTNTYPLDDNSAGWKAAGYDTASSTIPGGRATTLPVQAGVVGGQGGNEDAYTASVVNLTGAFQTGQNVIAIELHQNDAGSSDAGLAFQLTPADPAVTGGFTGVDDAFFRPNPRLFNAEDTGALGGSAKKFLRIKIVCP